MSRSVYQIMSCGIPWATRYPLVAASLFAAALASCCAQAAEPSAEPVNFQKIAPILTKYCVGCHNDTDREGKLSLQSYDALRRGGQKGSVVTPGQPESSRLVRVLTGQAEPKMPPEGEAAPTKDEIQRIAAWIAAGAKGPAGQSGDLPLVTPVIPVKVPPKLAVHALAVHPRGNLVAVARHHRVELATLPDFAPVKHWDVGTGSVQGLDFSRDGRWLAIAAGEPALFGEARLVAVEGDPPPRTFRGHRDSLYAARLSPDGRWLATAGYDHQILLWDVALGQVVRTLEGHNGAVFDLAFRPDGRVLASASGDRTVKLWDATSGQRRDTLKEPLKEVYTLVFSPDGSQLAAAGVDNRIRIWRISPTAEEGTNPLIASQFAHETPVLRLAWSPDGRTLVSSGEDRLVKVWEAQTLTLRQTLPLQPDWVTALAITPDSQQLIVGRVDGSVAAYPLRVEANAATELPPPLPEVPPEVDYGPQPPLEALPQVAEVEPNDQPAQALALPLPGRATGRIFRENRTVAPQEGVLRAAESSDSDLYRFEAQAGEQWVFQTRAAQAGSPLDSKLEILDASGKPVPRLLLRAVRDSVIEFRGMSSEQRGVRLANWEEMLLNDYVYLSGDVIKLFQQRRGPDADAQFYPESGNRMAFFDTTSRAHALGEPAYVVVPYRVGTSLPDNGLPVFTLYYENDDDGLRELGKDSRLTFVAPADGVYLVRVSDVRGFEGPQFTYELIAQRPQRDFEVSFTPASLTVSPGSGRPFTLKARRKDQYFGPITVELTGLPAGFHATTPVVIQAGLYEASGAIYAQEDAKAPSAHDLAQVQLVARGEVYGQPRQKAVPAPVKLALAARPKVRVWLAPLDEQGEAAGQAGPPQGGAVSDDAARLPVLRIHPGGTTAAQLRVVRDGFSERIALEVLGLPHGVIVDDIGLNGVLIPPGQTERKIFLRAEPWVPPQSRLCFAVAQVDGNQASPPVRIEVVSP
jgi:hypothetical protein